MRPITICLLILASGLLISCHEKMYRKVIPATRKQIKLNPYGAYTELLSVSEKVIIGEALALSEDTLLLLGGSSVMKISVNDIQQIKLTLTRNAADNYLIATAILTIPALLGTFGHSDYLGGFAIVGLITFGSGGLAALIESGRKGEIKTFPGEITDTSELAEYCRFPRGIPSDVDIDSLKGHLD